LQKKVALSTMEAEYMALCEASKEAVWLNKLVQSVASQGLRTAISGGPINIKVDNSGCIDFSKNPVEHKRTKHIDIRYHFVREAITTNKVTLEHCATDDMVADPMTKELGKTKHDKHVDAMEGVTDHGDSTDVESISANGLPPCEAPRRAFICDLYI